MDIRKNQATLTAAEKAAFVAAVKALKANGSYDTFVAQHRAAFLSAPNDPAHSGPAFLPWHREYLRRFELALQAIDPSVSLPYWDWTVDNSPNSSLWDPNGNFMGGNGVGANQQVMTGPFAFSTGTWTLTVLDPGETRPYLRRRLGAMGSLPTPQSVTNALGVVPYDAAPWNDTSNTNASFRNRLEGVIHNPGHMWVGGSMMAMSSPNDPVFWLHHCNIDRLWAIWQGQHPKEGYLPPSGTPGVVAGHGLDDPMPPWAGEANPPTPSKVLDHLRLGYAYDTDVLTFASDAFPGVYLRTDGTGVTAPTGPGGGTVNCQFGFGPWEKFKLERQSSGTVAIASIAFPGVYLRMDGSGVSAPIGSGGGTVNCQFGVGPWEEFKLELQNDGTFAIASIAYPGVYLRMDGNGVTAPTGPGGGTVNCQFGVGPWEKFKLAVTAWP